MDRDHPVSTAQYQRRLAIFDAVVCDPDDDCELDELRDDFLDKRYRYLAIQYSMGDSGRTWLTLGKDPLDLIRSLVNDEYWYAPHEVYDLDTGEQITYVLEVVLGPRSLPNTLADILAEMDPSDQIAFLGLTDEDPADSVYGRCDTCGSPCNHNGCTVDRYHDASIP